MSDRSASGKASEGALALMVAVAAMVGALLLGGSRTLVGAALEVTGAVALLIAAIGLVGAAVQRARDREV
jgi:hypothetical protein